MLQGNSNQVKMKVLNNEGATGKVLLAELNDKLYGIKVIDNAQLQYR
jgi:hypothetical protein